MVTTCQAVVDQIAGYLVHRTSLDQLVDWTEHQMMDGEFESLVVRDAVARLGLADVRAFGLTWEDCEQILRSLGFSARVEIAATAVHGSP
jgi:hypothetical protein